MNSENVTSQGEDGFPPQQQEPPGRTNEMRPVPDHGEASYRGAGRLSGRRALITGGDSGIGRAVALAYAREGADVAFTYLREEHEDARTTRALVEAEDRTCVSIAADLRDPEECERVVRESVNSSIQAYDPSETLLDYASTKAAINNVTVNLAAQLGPRGIRVNAVAPGPIWTPLQPATQTVDKIEHFGEDTPLGRAGQPSEVAPAFVFLASDREASYISGTVLGVTGGKPVF